MQRYIETLFRRKLLFLVPFIILPILTLLSILLSEPSSVVGATVWVEPGKIVNTGSSGRIAPNEVLAQVISDRLGTVAFLNDVMDRSGFTAAIEAGAWPQPTNLQTKLDGNGLGRFVLQVLQKTPPSSVGQAKKLGIRMISRSIKVRASGANLVLIQYIGPEPALGQRFIEEILNLNREAELEARVRETEIGRAFLEQELSASEVDLRLAQEETQRFEEQFPPPIFGLLRPPQELKELTRLQGAVRIEQTRYDSMVVQLEQLRFTSQESISLFDLPFRVIDPAEVNGTASIGLRRVAMMGIMGVILGTLLGTVAIVISTWRDSTVRTITDVTYLYQDGKIFETPLIPMSKKQRPKLLQIAFGFTNRSRADAN